MGLQTPAAVKFPPSGKISRASSVPSPMASFPTTSGPDWRGVTKADGSRFR